MTDKRYVALDYGLALGTTCCGASASVDPARGEWACGKCNRTVIAENIEHSEGIHEWRATIARRIHKWEMDRFYDVPVDIFTPSRAYVEEFKLRLGAVDAEISRIQEGMPYD